MPLGWQIIVRYRDDRVLTPSLACTRRLAASIGRTARPFALLAFGVADSHAHLACVGERPAAGELARRVLIGLHQVLGRRAPLERARLVAVHDQRHLQHLFGYLLGQAEHHGLESDPLREGTNLPDLLGLRLNAAWTAGHVRAHLPRVTRAELEARLGLAPGEGALDPGCLREAACSALAVGALHPRTEVGRAGLAAAVQVGRGAVRTRELATALNLHRSTVWKLGREAPPPVLVEAVRRQWALRSKLDASAPHPNSNAPPSASECQGLRYWLRGTDVGYRLQEP